MKIEIEMKPQNDVKRPAFKWKSIHYLVCVFVVLLSLCKIECASTCEEVINIAEKDF